MKENQRLSSSEQYIKKSNRKLFVLGFLLLFVFIIALLFLSDTKRSHVESTPIQFVNESVSNQDPFENSVNIFERGDATLKITPEQISMDNVVIGSKVEAIITLTAEKTPVIFQKAEFAENQTDGFTFETTCQEETSIPVGSSCIIKIMWNPVSLRQIQNILNITWKEDSQTSFESKTSTVQVKAQSTDSKDCVICETVAAESIEKEPKMAMGLNGEGYVMNPDGSITINGETIHPKDGLYINKNGEIVAIAEPEKLPLNLNNEIIGSITENKDVIDSNGEKVGRLLGDDTIVDSNLEVIGAAVPVVAAMDMSGKVFAKLVKNGTVVDAAGTVVGKPLADGSIASLDNRVIGVLRPWGLVSDLTGKIIGGIISDATIMSGEQKIIGKVSPNGLAFDSDNMLIGGTIPQGVVVGAGCQAIGRVLFNGTVKDTYNQEVGKVLIDGTAISTSGKDIGTVVAQSLVINEKGSIIGFVNSEGKAVGSKGNVIGCINPDGSITAGKKTIGSVMPKGRIIGYGCEQVGAVFPDGSAISPTLEPIGKVMSDQYVKNNSNEIIGVVIPRGSAIADGCRLLGLISITGNILDDTGKTIGCMTPDKNIINQDGELIGTIATKGVVANAEGRVVGRLRLDGKVMDFNGNVIGCVNPDGSVTFLDGTVGNIIVDANGNPKNWTIKDGKVYDENGNLIGTVYPDGTIRDKDGNIIGRISKTSGGYITDANGNPKNWTIKDGKVYDENGNLIGTVYPDGTIRDKDGNIIGYVNKDKKKGSVIYGTPTGKNTGIILDANGKPTGWTVIGNEVFDANGNKIGLVDTDGLVVSAENGKFLGSIPPDGVIFSTDGLILGRYSSKTGYAVNQNGERFGRVLHDLTVIDGNGEKIIGALIPNNTSFMNKNDQYVGTMTVDGTLKNKNGTIIGAIRANGTVVDDKNNLVAIRIPQGQVLSVTGGKIGTVSTTGEILSESKSVIGHINAAGLAISNNNQIIGGVFNRLSVAMNGNELIGYPNISGEILDANGNKIARATPFGIVISKEGVIARMMPFGVYTNAQSKLIGWTSFNVDLTDKNDTKIGKVLSNGLGINKTGDVIGYIVQKGVTVDTLGRHLGYMSIDNSVTIDGSKKTGIVYGSNVIYGAVNNVLGRVLNPGVAVDVNGKYLGFLASDGTILTTKNETAFVWFDNHVINNKGEIIGTYIPFNSVANTDETTNPFPLNEKGTIINAKGKEFGKVIAPYTVMDKGTLVAKLSEFMPYTSNFQNASTDNLMLVDGTLIQATNNKTQGQVMTNNFAINLVKQTTGALTPQGAPVTTSLTPMGRTLINGTVLLRIKKEGKIAGNNIIYDSNDNVSGMVLPSGTFIGKSGLLLGHSAASSDLFNKDGKNIAVQLNGGIALSTDNYWAGGKMPHGVVVNDDAEIIGTIAADGAILNSDGKMAARILSDGSAAKISDRELFNTMPYAGAIVQQGLPYSYKNIALGRTNVQGDVLDSTDEKTFKILDDGTILGGDEPLEGAILPYTTAIDHAGNVMGTLTSKGEIRSNSNEKKGKIAVNGTVKAGEYTILGALIPEQLITNDCKVIGKASPNGQIIDARGTIVGRIRPDKWAINPQGEKIGRVTRNGIVMSPEGKYLGRTMPDSTVVDNNGVNIGCSRNDGTVINEAGDVIGGTIERGLVLGEDGKPIGRVNARGEVLNKNGEVIGSINSKGEAIDLEGKVIGRVVQRDEELLYDENGNIKGTFSSEGIFKDPEGREIFKVLPDGTVVDPYTGEIIGRIENNEFVTNDGRKTSDLTLLLDKDGKPFGRIIDCDVFHISSGEKIGSISPDGSIVDLNGEIFAKILGTGKILDKDGNEMGSVAGTSTKLEKCGIKSMTEEEYKALLEGTGFADGSTTSATGRGIFIGNKVYGITDKGSIVNDEGIVIGYMGEDGKPYTLDNRLLSPTGDSHGRIRPNIDKKITVTPEQVEQMQTILHNRRAEMKAGIKSNRTILPTKRIQAMGRKKIDANWEKIGVNKIISSYPVDMSRMILKDKAIPAVLVRSIDSRYAESPVTAIVERNVYAEAGRNIIIPAGSRLIGSFKGEQGSETRVAKLEITWERLIRPDGGAFTFKATSGDAQGRGGIAAYLDQRLVERFGKPIMTSVVTSAVSYMMAANDDAYVDQYGNQVTTAKAEAANDARKNFIDSMQTIFDQLIEDSAAIEPVIFVPSGTRLTVYSNEDLWLRSEVDDIEEAGESEETSVGDVVGGSSSESKGPAFEPIEPEESNEDEEDGDLEENQSSETSKINDDVFYKPQNLETDTNSEEQENINPTSAEEKQVAEEQKDSKKQTIDERKVQPVLPKIGSADKLF